MMGNSFGKLNFVLLMVLLGLMATQSLVIAQAPFPTHPVMIWVGFPAGGGTDIILRALAESTENSLGQRILVVNKPGGTGAVCASLIAKVKPDGYTIAGFSDVPITRSPHLMDLDYDPFRDLSYVIRVGFWKNAFVVRADSPFKKWEDVVDWAKKNPGQLVYGYPGAGSVPHLGMAKIAIKEGFAYKGVPFAGAGPLVSALLGGHVMVGGGDSLAWRGHVQAGTVRVLLVFEKEGLDYASSAPTFEKAHYDFELPTSVIICAPAGIPDLMKEVLEKAFIGGMTQERFKRVAKDQELLLTEPLTRKPLVDYLRKRNLLYEQYIKEAGIYKIEKK